MARVNLGFPDVSRGVRVGGGRCVKTGQPTDQHVTISGSTIPPWVHVLLVFTFFGWILAMVLSSRRYRVVVPMRSEVHRRWRRWRAVSAGLVVLGLAATTLTYVQDRASLVPLLASVISVLLGTANAMIYTIGVRRGASETIELTRVHPSAVRAILDARRAEVQGAPVSLRG